MQRENYFEKIWLLKDRFKSFFQHRKKIKALENYSCGHKFHHKSYLGLIKVCMKEGFLQEEESDFLGYMLHKYEINYLDWAHRTKWLKSHLKANKPKRPSPVQTFFEFDRPAKTPIAIPVEILAAKMQQIAKRI